MVDTTGVGTAALTTGVLGTIVGFLTLSKLIVIAGLAVAAVWVYKQVK